MSFFFCCKEHAWGHSVWDTSVQSILDSDTHQQPQRPQATFSSSSSSSSPSSSSPSSGGPSVIDFSHYHHRRALDRQDLRKAKSAPKPSSSTVRVDIGRKVEALSRHVERLQHEKKAGTREIELIDTEISEIQAEITRLKRKYLNWFYYF